MAKKETNSFEKVKFIVYIILAIIGIGSALFGIEAYFAKEKDVNEVVKSLKDTEKSLTERVEMGIIDDQIFQQEQTIQRIEDWQRFEQRSIEPELTPIEEETLVKARERLNLLKNRKEEKLQHYKNGEN